MANELDLRAADYLDAVAEFLRDRPWYNAARHINGEIPESCCVVLNAVDVPTLGVLDRAYEALGDDIGLDDEWGTGSARAIAWNDHYKQKRSVIAGLRRIARKLRDQ